VAGLGAVAFAGADQKQPTSSLELAFLVRTSHRTFAAQNTISWSHGREQEGLYLIFEKLADSNTLNYLLLELLRLELWLKLLLLKLLLLKLLLLKPLLLRESTESHAELLLHD
jgi:hypothetical protein